MVRTFGIIWITYCWPISPVLTVVSGERIGTKATRNSERIENFWMLKSIFFLLDFRTKSDLDIYFGSNLQSLSYKNAVYGYGRKPFTMSSTITSSDQI